MTGVSFTLLRCKRLIRALTISAQLSYWDEELRKGRPNSQEISNYEQRINDAGVEQSLRWLIEWVKACYCYREGEFERAHSHYVTAFQCGKYAAGNRQNALVYEYVESYAKTKKWVEYKKGVAWARYMNIKLRLMIGESESPEELEAGYNMLQMITYIR